MSATTVVDLGPVVQSTPSINAASGGVWAASGATIGNVVDLINCNNYCNVSILGTAAFGSGQLRVQVQVSDGTTSGSFTDPTSGMVDFPTWMKSGGIFTLNSGGLLGGLQNTAASGQYIASGFQVFGAFIRNGRYVRANVLSGDFYAGVLGVSFVSQRKVIGSGAGFTYAPGSGTINV